MKGKIKVKEIGVCSIYEIGNWAKSYPWIKLGYLNEEYEPKYSDIGYCVKNGGGVIGYFYAYSKVCLSSDDIVCAYDRKLVLYDFAVDDRAYSKYGKALLDFLVDYAKKCGYKSIELKKFDEYSFFFDYLKRHYKPKETATSYNLVIENPKVKLSRKHLRIYQNDSVQISDLYFLHDVGFKILKNEVKSKTYFGENIRVDRSSGKIFFPSWVKTDLDLTLCSQTKCIVNFVYERLKDGKTDEITIEKSLFDDSVYYVLADGTLNINKDVYIVLNNGQILFECCGKNFAELNSIIVGYDMHDGSFSYSGGRVNLEKMLKKYSFECFFEGLSIVEKNKERIQIEEFNKKLIDIQRFEFNYNLNEREKRFTVAFGKQTEILSNGNLVKGVDSQFVISKLAILNFSKWQKEYGKVSFSTQNNAWQVKVVLKDETLEFKGENSYPENWDVVINVIDMLDKIYIK